MSINLEVNDTICYVQVTKMSRQSVQFSLDVNLLKKKRTHPTQIHHILFEYYLEMFFNVYKIKKTNRHLPL